MARPAFKSAKRHPKVHIALGLGYNFLREAIAGVVSYARENGPWEFVGQLDPIANPKMIDDTPELDGVIFYYFHPEFEHAIKRRGIPAVSIGSAHQIPGIPHVTANSEAVAAMAYQYLRRLGFERYAIYGGGASYRMDRFRPFRELVEKDRGVCHDLGMAIHHRRSNGEPASWTGHMRQLKKKLLRLQDRTAVFAWSSEEARVVIAACDEIDRNVPDQIAVLGVDDDEAICELASPPISAVDHGCETIGWEAARILDALMHRQPITSDLIRVDPVRIVARQSTNTLAIDDPIIVSALRFIQRNFAEAIAAADVTRHLKVSRPTLEKHLRRTLGRTVHQQIILTRIEHAKQLLQTTMLDMAGVSVRCGFSYPSKFSSIFHRETGVTPQLYRQQHLIRRKI